MSDYVQAHFRDTCLVCMEDSQITCGQCEWTKYCSPACQLKDLPLHGLFCSSFHKGHFVRTDRPRPTAIGFDAPPTINPEWQLSNGTTIPVKLMDVNPKSIIAFRFPVNAPLPEIVVLKHETFNNFHPATGETYSDTYHHFVNINDAVSSLFHKANVMKKIKHQGGLEIYTEDRFYDARYTIFSVNQCLVNLNRGFENTERASKKRGALRFRGECLVVAYEWIEYKDEVRGEYSRKKYKSVRIDDLRHAFQFITRGNNYYESLKPNRFFLREPFPWQMAVVVSCFEHGMKIVYRGVKISRASHLFPERDTEAFPLLEHFGNVFNVVTNASKTNCLEGARTEYVVSRKDGKDLSVDQMIQMIEVCVKVETAREKCLVVNGRRVCTYRDIFNGFKDDLLRKVIPDVGVDEFRWVQGGRGRAIEEEGNVGPFD